MSSTGDERDAMALADKIVDSGDRGVSPSADDVEALASLVERHSRDAADALRRLRENRSSVSVADMFEMQMLTNHFSQLSDQSTNIISAANTAITSMVRNIKN